MESFWKKLEEEFGIKISDADRGRILEKGVVKFLERDLRYWEVEGHKYVDRPDSFREAFLRKVAKTHFKIKEEGEDGINSEDKSV